MEFKEPIVAIKSLKWLASHPQNRVWSLSWCVFGTKIYTGRK